MPRHRRTVKLEDDHDGTQGASGLVRGAESGPEAAMDTAESLNKIGCVLDTHEELEQVESRQAYLA